MEAEVGMLIVETIATLAAMLRFGRFRGVSGLVADSAKLSKMQQRH